ncbi:MAG: 3-oxoacyl-ACP reductase [Xanthobacteraceae bacterium]|jgi:NAD(P)-dependent dehydrogenase (short-subunit alcohol dehydrogenase family)|nr:3-oxoacyl-ACP reductase [Xanthobacteraceae bacterium]
MDVSTKAPAPDFRLDGRRVLVTGAGRGIGLAASLALARYGAQVTLTARSADELEAAADQVRAAGGVAETLPLDLRNSNGVAAALAERPAFDVLVNNAGMNRTAPFLDVPQQDFDDIIGLNVRALYFTAQAVARGMASAGRGGSIINMSSQMGHVGAPTRTVYCASKWAVEGMTRAMALDLAPYGIRVNTIGPTFVETPMSGAFLKDDTFKATVLSKIKLGRIGHVDDITGAIVFLASGASALMTGASMVIDGGWTAD